MAQVHDSPNSWIAEHIRCFEETGGRPRPGVNDLLLTTRGRKTGDLRGAPEPNHPGDPGGCPGSPAGRYLIMLLSAPSTSASAS
jgi:hypothetical protein